MLDSKLFDSQEFANMKAAQDAEFAQAAKFALPTVAAVGILASVLPIAVVGTCAYLLLRK